MQHPPIKLSAVRLVLNLLKGSGEVQVAAEALTSGISSRTIVMLTGAFVDHACWDDWKAFFESKGYTVIVPPWPHKDGDAVTLRSRQPDAALAALTLSILVDFYSSIVSRLPEKPILIGHSFGGLLVQILLNRGYAAAGIAIHSVPPKGILPYEFNFLKSNIKALGFFTSPDKPYLIPFKKWQFVFTNGMSLEDQHRAYDRLAIPESKRVLRGGLTSAAAVDFRKPHPPLLILSGSYDHCIPASLGRRTAKRYKNKGSIIEFVVKPRNHFILGLPTWKEDAEFVLDWIQKH